MKTAAIIVSLLVLILMAVPVSAEASTISSVSPSSGYSGTTTTVTIVGTNFNESSVTPKLIMTGKGNITTSTISSHNSTVIVCSFILPSDTGSWGMVVVNQDNSEVNKIDAFRVVAPVTLSSIAPDNGRRNNVSTKVSIAGSGLSGITSMYLYNSAYSNTSASGLVAVSSSMLNGTFDLTGKTIDTYKICVVDSLGATTCGLSFKVTSDAVGRLDISSNPSGAILYIDGTNKGTTPVTLDNLDVGNYKLILKKDGYVDWTRTAIITNGTTTSYSANLETKTAAPTTTVTTAPTTVPTTVKITRKVTVTTPTPWPSDTPTQASPVGMIVIIGGIGLGLLAARRH